jgi:hypothetical protein
MDLTDLYKVFHLTAAPYTFFSSIPWNIFQNRYILGQKTSLTKYKKVEITPFILPDHSEIKLELNDKTNYRKYSNIGRVNNALLNDQWVIEETRCVCVCVCVCACVCEIKKFLNSNKNENTTYQNLCDTGKTGQRGKFIAMSAHIAKKPVRSQINNWWCISSY